MTESETSIDRRAQLVAGLGFILQLVCFGTLLGISLWADSDAIEAVARFMVIGLPIWAVLYLVFKQTRRVSAEQIETAELKRAQQAGASTALFELDDESLLLEQNRLRSIVRWMLPAVSVLLAVVLVGGHFLFWGWPVTLERTALAMSFDYTDKPELMMWFVVGIGFICFLYARYAIALARLPDWHLLRAGAACTAGNALACLGLVIALMAGSAFDLAEPLIAIIIRILLVLIGLEFTVNLILDFYRPRTGAGIPRPSFDSRLLGLISEPGGIAKSIADAVDYQFGFAVSTTWFYQFLQRWMLPIVVATIVVVLALSSVVIVDADEQVVVERFGRRVGGTEGALNPGLHVKWPFPIDVVYRAPVKRVSELIIGEATEVDDEDLSKPITWTETHQYVPELMLLVASPRERVGRDERVRDEPSTSTEVSEGGESVAVSLLMVSVPIEYRIKDIQKYLYEYADPTKVMEGVAYRYLSDFAASVDLDALMGPQRDAFNREIKTHLQQRLDALDLGIEIVFVGIRGAHPPARDKVAASFQSAISALTRKAAVTNAAEEEELKILTSVAGTKARADELDKAIQIRDELRSTVGGDPEKLAAAEVRVQDLLLGNPDKQIAPSSGAAAAMIADAQAAAATSMSQASAKVRTFSAEVAAYEAAPALYIQRKVIGVYEDLDAVRKYLITGNPENVIVEYETREQGGLDRVLQEKKRE